MKITNIRDLDSGKKLSKPELETIAEVLQLKINKAGFHAHVTVINSSRIDLSLRSKSFEVIPEILGYNATGFEGGYKKGYKLTRTPTWDQRVEYNNIVNSVLTGYKIKAVVKSGLYTIRTLDKVYIENDWFNQKPDWQYSDHNVVKTLKSISKAA